MNAQIKKEEELHLKNVIKKIKNAHETSQNSLSVISEENLERLKELREGGAGSYGYQMSDFDIFLEQLHEKNAALNIKGKYKTLEELEFLLKEPYFSRIDLYDPKTKENYSFYIGKFAYTEKQPVITDWRSKVASVYYRYRYPQKGVSYETPMGKEIRDLKLKRTFEIQDGSLVNYFNNDLQLDESTIMVEKIKKRSGGVLEDIIQTIQESQLDIIELDPRQICIVQGCVGSGKSTVAIHKLAHIFFNYPTVIHAERCLLIAKSQILAGYLSTLFPKLGIFDLTYKTVRDVAYNFLFTEDIKVKFDLGDNKETSEFSIAKIRKLTKALISIQKKYETRINKIFADPELESFASFKYSYNQTPYENLNDISEDIMEELNVQKDHLKKHPDSTNTWFYKENIAALRKILRKVNLLQVELKDKTIKVFAKEQGININSELNYFEVLAFLFIYSELIGLKKFRKYEYCVVDEAQDFSPIEYLFLSKVVMRGRFALFGDLNQTLQKDGITNWEVIHEVIKEAKSAVKFELKKNYRSTKQIIELANKILKKYTKDYLPRSIDREGEEPIINTYNDINTMTSDFEKLIKEDSKNIDKSIGIVCFSNMDEVEKILTSIKGLKDNYIKLDPSKKTAYLAKGVYLMSSDDCKGLEFSKVYVIGLNLKKVNSFMDARKAFVAVTRAMNDLIVMGVK